MELSTEERILKAAKEEFAEKGFEGARIDSIAARSGLNKAMIYYHFKSKEKLYEQILMNMWERIFQIIESESSSIATPLERVYSLTDRIIDFMSGLDLETKRLITWEFASGGKFLKEFIFPKFIIPLSSRVIGIYQTGQKDGSIREEINPIFTHMMVIGGTIFMNILTTILKDANIPGSPFREGFQEGFKKNIHEIFSSGIEKVK